LANRIKITLLPKNTEDQVEPNGGIFELILNKKNSYNQLAAKVGAHLKVDPTHVRFCPINVNNHRPKLPIKHTTTYQVGQLLHGYSAYGTPSHRPDGLYYEVLECSMAELEMRKFLKVTWLPDGANKEV
jgi:ubiquitin carboxyl-terminal hydrolase 7